MRPVTVERARPVIADSSERVRGTPSRRSLSSAPAPTEAPGTGRRGTRLNHLSLALVNHTSSDWSHDVTVS